MKRLSLRLLAFLVVFLTVPAFVSSALANTISYSASIAAQTTDLQGVPLLLPEFDSHLGTLTQVGLALTMNADTSFTALTTNPTNPGTASIRGNVWFSLSVTDSKGLITNAPQISNVSLVPLNGTGINTGYFVWSSPMATNVPVTTGPYYTTASGSASYTDSALLALLTGSGTTPLFVSTATSTSLSTHIQSPGTIWQDTHAGLDATITYQYTPVPIPGALLLFGPGLAGLIGIRRKIRGLMPEGG